MEHVNLQCKFSGSKTGSTVCVVWRKQNIEKQKITTLNFSIFNFFHQIKKVKAYMA